MLEIKKTEIPDFFDSWVKDERGHSEQLREFMLEKEQGNVCCYCEKRITSDIKDSHIEHIRPKSKYPKLKNNYDNLAASCQIIGRCGKAKRDTFNENFIVPTEENPGDHLTYSANGEIRAIDNNKKGNETIKILNLNAVSLVQARRTLFIQLNSMRDLDNFDDYFKDYPTYIKYFKENY